MLNGVERSNEADIGWCELRLPCGASDLAANLVVAQRHGREKLHFINPVPIGEIAARWIGKFERNRVDALVDLRRSLEAQGDRHEQ
nr:MULTISPECIES: hypothetical protein [unclassified Paraburkholderia]